MTFSKSAWLQDTDDHTRTSSHTQDVKPAAARHQTASSWKRRV